MLCLLVILVFEWVEGVDVLMLKEVGLDIEL